MRRGKKAESCSVKRGSGGAVDVTGQQQLSYYPQSAQMPPPQGDALGRPKKQKEKPNWVTIHSIIFGR